MSDKKYTILQGDCREMLKTLPDCSVHTCITSPPYFGLRDYGTSTWEGGDPKCDHVADPTKTKKFGNAEFNKNRPSREATKIDGYYFDSVCGKCGAKRKDSQIGLEQTPDEYVKQMVEVFREVRRVLRDDGTLWLNLGDSYAAQRGGTAMPAETLAGGVGGKGDEDAHRGHGSTHAHRDARAIGLKHKDLVGIPWRVAFALQADGWYLRQDIIWHKPNPMPESVTDRCTKAHEYIFMLSKSPRYFFDHEAIKEDAVGKPHAPGNKNVTQPKEKGARDPGLEPDRVWASDGKRNKRSVWTITTKPFKGAHFATFPEDLIVPCVLAGCPKDGMVLDPFNGAATTGVVALKNQRRYIGIELNPEYIKLSEERIRQQVPETLTELFT
jgi:DNA modification methylase